jgi:hypothetical protein
MPRDIKKLVLNEEVTKILASASSDSFLMNRIESLILRQGYAATRKEIAEAVSSVVSRIGGG